MSSIHASAVVSPGAKLGQNVVVGPLASIDDDVEIGAGTIIGPHVCLLKHTRLGENCRVHAGAVVGDVPQDRKFSGDVSYVEVGAGTIIREGVTIHRGTQTGSVTRVGRDCLLMAHCHVAHNVSVGDQVTVCNGTLLAGHVEVGSQAFISSNCLIHQFTRIGRLAMLSGATGTQMDVPPFCMTRSMYTNTVMNLNSVGLRRAGLNLAQRRELEQAFHVLYQSGLTISRAVEQMQRDFDSPLVREMCEFILASKRGICRFIREQDFDQDDRDDQGEFPRIMAA